MYPIQLSILPPTHPPRPSVLPSIYRSTVLLLDLAHFFSFLILYKFGRTPWTGNQFVAGPLPNTNTEYIYTDIHDSSGIRNHEASVPVSEDCSCLHRAPTVMGQCKKYPSKIRTGFVLNMRPELHCYTNLLSEFVMKTENL
jgi:hypothetical protein